ncbi:MAG: EutN/CcmL family microcompartment protein [Acidobacteriota bacterium]
MYLARVIGNVVATVKDPGLHSQKLLIIQPLTPAHQPTGEPLVAVDGAGVGVGEEVFYVRGREASFLLLPARVPADIGIVGKVDSVSLADGSARPGKPH